MSFFIILVKFRLLFSIMLTSNQKNIYNYGTENRVNKLKNVLEKRQKSITIVMENIADPHNFSACLRSCDAVGIFEICLLYHSGQEFSAIKNAEKILIHKKPKGLKNKIWLFE